MQKPSVHTYSTINETFEGKATFWSIPNSIPGDVPVWDGRGPIAEGETVQSVMEFSMTFLKCGICGFVETSGRAHTKEECDIRVARTVLED